MSKEIFLTTVSKEEYESLTEREKSIYDAGVKDGNKTSRARTIAIIIGQLLIFLLGVLYVKTGII